ncbi:MAG: anti-sigma factor [Actinomycetota bacterium]
MDDDRSPDRIDDLIALAALGELGEDEAAELDAAIAADPSIADELRDAIEAAAAIQSTHAADPPMSLRAGVLAAIADTPRSSDGDSPSDGLPAPTIDPRVDSPVDLAAERRRRGRVFGAVAAAAAVVALIVAGLVVTGSDSGDGGDEIAAVLQADDSVVRTLAGDLVGTVRVVHAPSEGAIVVDAEGLERLADDRVLQLWLVSDDGATPVGLFRPGEDGRVRERFDDVDPSGFVLGVTQEPAGGSAEPTLPILASS